MNPLIQLKTTPPLLITLTLLCIGLLPKADAVVPAPDGGYPGFNTAEGTKALFSLTTGVGNAAVGWYSLFSNTDGSFNTALGAGTLLFNVGDQSTGDGIGNTAIGAAALLFNTTGFNNTAIGAAALVNNADGSDNNAVGAFALNANTSGLFNNAHGRYALFSNVDGDQNDAFGDSAMLSNTAGSFNTAIGDDALFSCIDGDSNIAIGDEAGSGIVHGSNIIAIGHPGADVSDSCFIGNIAGVNQAGPSAAVFINTTTGQLGTTPPSSSRRFKHEIKPMDRASEAILGLKPVTFQYKNDKTGTPQFGLIAEEVAEMNQDLVMRDEKGEIYSVRYDAVNAMLLNEFLKEHRKNEEQRRDIQEEKATIARQQKQIEALTAGLQKVSAQLEAGKSALQVVNNP